MDNTSREIRELIDKLNYYTELYDKGTPQISDEEWDNMYFKLSKLEQENLIFYPDSPTQRINYTIKSKLDKVIHDQPPMLSLDKTKDVNTVSSFVKGHDWFGMFKMDGLSCRLVYENGNLIQASTRGNGIEGEDITHNAEVIKSIPRSIPYYDSAIVDGEIICDLWTFNDKFADNYANPRNLAAGSIRQLSNKECENRSLTFVAWDLVKGCDDIDFNFWRLEKLDEWGFITVPRVGDAETIEDAIDFLERENNAAYYPIDGFVFKFESKSYGESLGRTEHHFKNAIAYKFYDEEYETELLDIDWTMGRTGVLTPVAVFKPVDDGDSIIERASLHNVSVMKEMLGIPYKNQKIWVYKANMIIPQISKAEHIGGEPIIDPTMKMICPYCGEIIEIVESDSGVLNAMCGNPSCEGKLENKIDHYLGKKGLDAKGISKATIGKCIEWGWLNNISDVYKLKDYRNEWIKKQGFGIASVDKILNAIENSKNCELASFISAIGIPLVGRTIAKEIIKYYESWSDFREAVGGDWTEFEGFGPEISKAINNFDYTEADKCAGMLSFKILEIQPKVTLAAAIKDKKFCATGKVTHFANRDALKADIEAKGGKLVNSVTSKTDYLITNTPDSGTAKNRDAQRLGVKIITEEEYLNL